MQEAERSLHAVRQKLQETEDALNAADEKAGCLEAMLQQYTHKLAEVPPHFTLSCKLQRVTL